MFYINLLNDKGNFELIDGDFLDLYPNVDSDKLIPLSADDYQKLSNMAGLQEVLFVNGEFKGMTAQPTPYHELQNGEWVLSETAKATLKAQKIDQIKAKINALRDEKSAGGCYVESLGKWFDSDQAAYNNLLGFKAETDLNGEKTTYWACADNSLIEFDREKLKTVISTLWDVKTANHATALKHKAMLEQAENPEDYDYSTGWVKSYADFLKEQANDV